jgi:putative thiamine transport system ATP-binding protein
VELILEQVSIALAGTQLLRPFSLAVAAGEVVTLMGPSGCGKSSLLSYLAGDLAPPLSGRGRVLLGGTDLGPLPPEHRKLGRLFQDDLLFPHLTVGENLLFGMARGSCGERRKRMGEALAAADLAGFEDRPPATLSGGQRSRAALLRALLADPHAMLLDEPFSRLDMELRQAMRDFVFERLQRLAVPAILVTHDATDAPTGGRVKVIARNGEVGDA